MMTNKNPIFLTRKRRISSEELFYREDLSKTGTKISFLDIVFLEKILVRK
jgi:hypothetical protein